MTRPTSQQQLPNLEKLFKDDDEQDFAPLAGSNLAAIFGTPQKTNEIQTPLKQQPPQNKKRSSSGRSTPQSVVQPASKTEVIIAKVVHAYKLLNGQYSQVGKLGVALTGNASTRVYQLILYRGKQEHVSTVTLSPEFSYTIGVNNYATYYDSSNENWSLRFEDEASCVDFAREIGISRYNSGQRSNVRTEIFHQDLSSVETRSGEIHLARENDEIRLKSFIVASLAQPFDATAASVQELRVRVSPYDNWEKSLINCARGLRRLMILPPGKQIGLGPGYPKEREIVMEFEVVEVIGCDGDGNSTLALTSDKAAPPIASGKASILSRMAKMGQSMLPKAPVSTTTDSEDTEEEIRVKSPRRFKPEIPASLASAKHQSRGPVELPADSTVAPPPPVSSSVLVSHAGVPVAAVPVLPQRPIIASPAFTAPCWPLSTLQQQQQQQQQQYVAMDGQYYPLHPQPAIPQALPVSMDPNFNVFLAETRTQNTEIRMGMSKIADNVQKLLDKFHVLEVQSASSPMILRRPFHRCPTEESLYRDEHSSHYIDGEATGNNARGNYTLPGEDAVAEEFQRSRVSSERERRLENELRQAREWLDQRVAECVKLEVEKRQCANDKTELEERLVQLKKALLNEKIARSNADETVVELREKNSALSKSSVAKINAEKMSPDKPEMESSASIDEKTADIKRLMNNTYRMLLAQFTDDESYTAEYIKDTLADTIRRITFSVLSELQHDGTDEERSENVAYSVSDSERKGSSPEAQGWNTSTANPVTGNDPPPLPPMDEDVAPLDAS